MRSPHRIYQPGTSYFSPMAPFKLKLRTCTVCNCQTFAIFSGYKLPRMYYRHDDFSYLVIRLEVIVVVTSRFHPPAEWIVKRNSCRTTELRQENERREGTSCYVTAITTSCIYKSKLVPNPRERMQPFLRYKSKRTPHIYDCFVTDLGKYITAITPSCTYID